MLLEFGVISRRYRHATGEHKVVITNRAQAELFAQQIGFGGTQADKLVELLAALPERAAGMDGDHVPGLAAFIRAHSGGRGSTRNGCGRTTSTD